MLPNSSKFFTSCANLGGQKFVIGIGYRDGTTNGSTTSTRVTPSHDLLKEKRGRLLMEGSSLMVKHSTSLCKLLKPN